MRINDLLLQENKFLKRENTLLEQEVERYKKEIETLVWLFVCLSNLC